MVTKSTNLEYIKQALKDIRREKDPEAAHAMEDDLWEATLEMIAEGAENAPELAKTALKTRRIEFPRWYA